jgi:hypothetical protein
MRAWKLLTLVLLAGCAAGLQQGTPISVTFHNGSERPLRCLLVFAHWTTIDLPVLQPGGSTAIVLYRAADRALFLPRAGDGRRMMLEALHCGYDDAWSRSLARLDWTAAMRSGETRFVLNCAAGERPACRWN